MGKTDPTPCLAVPARGGPKTPSSIRYFILNLSIVKISKLILGYTWETLLRGLARGPPKGGQERRLQRGLQRGLEISKSGCTAIQ